MVWQGTRRKELPPDWAQRRETRLQLDGYRCTAPVIVVDGEARSEGSIPAAMRVERCPSPATDVHHAFAGNDHRIESLRSLCADHHKGETQREAQQAQGRGASRLRPKRPHPGLR